MGVHEYYIKKRGGLISLAFDSRIIFKTKLFIGKILIIHEPMQNLSMLKSKNKDPGSLIKFRKFKDR